MKAISTTRDQIDNFDSQYGNRYISLDFNHSGRAEPASGIEIKIPNDLQYEEEECCWQWAYKLQEFYHAYGHKVPLRHGDGLKRDGRGVSGVIHTEPFFVGYRLSREIIHNNAAEYIQLVSCTLGFIPNAIFILPHKKNAPGAVSRDGQYNERDFARYVLMPHMQRYAGQGPEEVFVPYVDNEFELPSVTFTEEIRPA